MADRESEHFLANKTANIPQSLTRGGLIVGSDASVTGSLMSLSGMAIERVTRQRTEVPPDQRLPENAVYFIDPEASRLIMVSRRESYPEWKSGLFAETVELDGEGKPRFRMSTKEVTFPQNQFQMVAVGPNPYNLPPSHINMVEEETPGQEKFVPWNLYLASLQTWMNEVSINPEENFESFMKKFDDLRNKSKEEAKTKIKTAFIGGPQGFDETVAPFNLIITDDINKEAYLDASRDAGLYPFLMSPKAFVQVCQRLPDLHESFYEGRRNLNIFGDWKYSIGHWLPEEWGSVVRNYSPAVITHDWTSVWRLEDQDRAFVEEVLSPAMIHKTNIDHILKNNPIFSYIYLMRDVNGDPKKEGNGAYHCPNTGQTYRELLYKIKADLLLTMFLRGGAPMVK